MRSWCAAWPLLAALAAVSCRHAPVWAPVTAGHWTPWAPADKVGFGTARAKQSPVWFTLGSGRLTEVYYPRIDTPSVRELVFWVSDGHAARRVDEAAQTEVSRVDPRALAYRLVSTSADGAWRLVHTYVTDPERATLLVQAHLEALDGRPRLLLVQYDPALANGDENDAGRTLKGALVAEDGAAASALLLSPPAVRSASVLAGPDDGLEALASGGSLTVDYERTAAGNLIQLAQTSITGLPKHQDLTLALGFAPRAADAVEAAKESLRAGFASRLHAFVSGWQSYLASLPAGPSSVARHAELYDISLLVLAASEDKKHPGAFVASPTMPWVWGTGAERPSGPYHLVWARDAYHVATALLAAGDRAAAERIVEFLFGVQQLPDGNFPQNSDVDGTPRWTEYQLDQTGLSLCLAWSLGRTDRAFYDAHLRRAAEAMLHAGMRTQQERWENQPGFSPGSIAAGIAGFVCAADLARRAGAFADTARYLQTADMWREQLDARTVTRTGPLAQAPYYLRLAPTGEPDLPHRYETGDGGPVIDAREAVDASFLELTRLGVVRASAPLVRQTLAVVDAQLKVSTPGGDHWRRYPQDGYGETADGADWEISTPEQRHSTRGRAWPLLAGERGEHRLLLGESAQAELTAMAASANEGLLLPEQVWDLAPPVGDGKHLAGRPTRSAAPLAWSHAQFVRLAWSIAAGRPVERPSVVACRYADVCIQGPAEGPP